MVPKRIITTWICDPGGRDAFSDRHREILEVCLRSWLRLMPDYQLDFITKGTLDNDPEAKADVWLQERMAEGNYIGASQWARLVWLMRHGGGIFLDADVEAVKRFDSLLDTVYTVGHLGNGQHFANNAVMAVDSSHMVALAFLQRQFAHIKTCDPRDEGFGNLTGPFMLTSLLREKGWDGQDRDQEVAGITVRRSEVFYPYDWNEGFSAACLQPDTIAMHHWASSWKPRGEQPAHEWR